MAERSPLDATTLAGALSQPVWIASADGACEFVNPAWTGLTGQTLDAALGDGFLTCVHPADLGVVLAGRAAALVSGVEYALEVRLRRPDATFAWTLWREARAATHWVGSAADIDERRRLGAAESALRFMVRAGVALSRSLDLQTILDTLLDLLVPSFGDWATINIRQDDGRILTLAARHSDPAKAVLIERLRGVTYHNPASSVGTAAVYRSARPQIFEHLTMDVVRTAILPEYVPIVEDLGIGSFVAVPIVSGGVTIGTLGISSVGDARAYAPEDARMLEELAIRASVAIENARRYEREHKVAQALQAAALPAALPSVPGLTFDAHYEAGSSEALVGGDWYDAMLLGDGLVLISIGDVSGSGINAAVTMAQMRQVIRGSAQVYADPLTILDAADRSLRSDESDRFATAFVGVLDPLTLSLSYALAGHPPPFVLSPDGSVQAIAGSAGLPLGLRMRDTVPAIAGECRLAPGSLLVLYTDGLTEATHDLAAGESRLLSALTPELFLDERPALHVRRAVLRNGSSPDDVAIMTVHVSSDTPVERWSFETRDSEAARRVRRGLCERLGRLGASSIDVAAAELVFGELIANAVRYAPGLVDVALELDRDAPVLHVLDRGPSFSLGALEAVDPMAERGRGLFIASQLTESLAVASRHDKGSHVRASLLLAREPP